LDRHPDGGFESVAGEPRFDAVSSDALAERLGILFEPIEHACGGVNGGLSRIEDLRNAADMVDMRVRDEDVFDFFERVPVLRDGRFEHSILLWDRGVDEDRFGAIDEITGDVPRRPLDVELQAMDPALAAPCLHSPDVGRRHV